MQVDERFVEHFDLAVRIAGAVAAGVEGILRISLYMLILSGFLGDFKSRYRAL